LKTYTGLMLTSFFLAAALTPLAMKLAPILGAIDHPDSRKIHNRAVPRLGGAAIVLACFIPLLLLPFIGNRITEVFAEQLNKVMALVAASLCLFVLGVADDIRGVRPITKLVCQTACACAVFYAGYRISVITLPFGGALNTGILAAPLTVVWIVGITNAFNFIDGIDGAAAGIAAIAAFAIAGAADPVVTTVAWAFSAVIIGANLGFLIYNFHPARIFMGDSGSMFLGFILAVIAVSSSQKTTVVLGLAVPAAVFALLIADTCIAVARRLLRGQAMSSGDKEHIHHKLLAMGMGQGTAAVVLYGLAGICALAGMVMVHSRRALLPFSALFLALFLGVVFKGIYGHPKAGADGDADAPEKE